MAETKKKVIPKINHKVVVKYQVLLKADGNLKEIKLPINKKEYKVTEKYFSNFHMCLGKIDDKDKDKKNNLASYLSGTELTGNYLVYCYVKTDKLYPVHVANIVELQKYFGALKGLEETGNKDLALRFHWNSINPTIPIILHRLSDRKTVKFS